MAEGLTKVEVMVWVEVTKEVEVEVADRRPSSLIISEYQGQTE